MSEDVVQDALEQDVAVEEVDDATTKAQANAEQIIKDAQRKQSAAQEALRRAQQYEEAAKARYAESEATAGEDDPIAQARKVIADEVNKALEAQNAKTEEQQVSETIQSFVDASGASDVQVVAIFDHFEKESIAPKTPKALERAMHKAYKSLYQPDDAIEARLKELEKEGAVVRVARKKSAPEADTRPIHERSDLSYEQKRNLIWKRS